MTKILIACEYSGIVRDAFRAKGNDAWSCDLEATESNPKYHIQGDALKIINDGWDMMIAHPPCTFLTNAANRWLYEDCSTGTAKDRHLDRDKAIEFFNKLLDAPIHKIAIENPFPHPYVIEKVGRICDYVQPYNFGEPETKGIYLWLKNLPPLMSTIIEQKREPKTHMMAPSPDRQKERSRFFKGIAEAMADQWI